MTRAAGFVEVHANVSAHFTVFLVVEQFQGNGFAGGALGLIAKGGSREQLHLLGIHRTALVAEATFLRRSGGSGQGREQQNKEILHHRLRLSFSFFSKAVVVF